MTREEAASISRAAIYSKLGRIIDAVDCKIAEESRLGKFRASVEIKYADGEDAKFEYVGDVKVRDLIEKFYSSLGFGCSIRYIRFVGGSSAIIISVSW